MEQPNNDTADDDTCTPAGSGEAVITAVTEKHESELLEKSIPGDDSVSELHNDEDSTELSAVSAVSGKEDGRVTSTRYLFRYLLKCLCEI